MHNNDGKYYQSDTGWAIVKDFEGGPDTTVIGNTIHVTLAG